MPETESDSIDIDLSRLNYNILKAIENNYEAFIRLNKLDKAYIKFRLNPKRFIDDCPYRPTMFNVSRKINPELIDIIGSPIKPVDLTQLTDDELKAIAIQPVDLTQLKDKELKAIAIHPVDLTQLQDKELKAIADDPDAFEYLNFKEQVWLCNTLKRPMEVTDPEPFFPSMHLINVINTAPFSAGGKRIKSRKPRRKTRRKTRRHN